MKLIFNNTVLEASKDMFLTTVEAPDNDGDIIAVKRIQFENGDSIDNYEEIDLDTCLELLYKKQTYIKENSTEETEELDKVIKFLEKKKERITKRNT